MKPAIISRGARGEAEGGGILVQSVDTYHVDLLEKSRAQCAVNAHGRINDAPVIQSMGRISPRSPPPRERRVK
jgi:hypothetical protein